MGVIDASPIRDKAASVARDALTLPEG